MRHDSTNHEAARLARRAVAIRAKAHHEASALRANGFEAAAAEAELAGEHAANAAEAKALKLAGYRAPVAHLPWAPSVHDRLPVARKLVGVCLGLALGLGIAADVSACSERAYQAEFDRVAARDDGRDPHAAAAAFCEAASWPGTYEWAHERAGACPDDYGTSWAEQDERGAWFAVCGTDDGTPWLTVRP